MAVVEFKGVDVVFGGRQREALALLDAGQTREEIHAASDAVIGVAGAELAVEEGRICVLMGLSGSGKSSLLRCVNGLNKVSRGTLLVSRGGGGEAVDVASCSADALRQLRMNRIAMVFQQFGLLPWRTVRENVGFGLELKGLPKSEIDRIVDEKLALVHLEQWSEKLIAELSGGMQQRVGLARAFATDGDILLMDEPFSALDPLIRHHLQDELLALQRRLKKTIIFVSHDLDEALKLGNHIAIMDGGHIVQQGPPEQIVLQPANEYVRQFVANMNPLQVLNATALMTPLAALPRDGELLLLEGGIRLSLDADGGIASIASGAGKALPLCDIERFDGAAGEGEAPLLRAGADTGMRALVAARRRTRRPILIADGPRLLGAIGERELYDGLLRQGAEHS